MEGPGIIHWVESRGLPSRFWQIGVMLAIYLIVVVVFLETVVGWTVLARAIEFAPEGGAWSETLAFYILFLAAPLTVLLMAMLMGTTRIGIGPTGLRVVTRLRTRDIAWDSLRPGLAAPKGEWDVWRFGMSQRMGPSFFWLTKDQARAILTDPRAPSALFPPEYWTWAGLSPQPLRQKT